MQARRFLVLALLTALILSIGCGGAASDPSSNDGFADTGVDTGNDGDVGVGSDVANDDATTDADTDDAHTDVIDAGDETDTGTGTDPETDTAPPPPTPESWDCDPDVPLDAERYVDLKGLDADSFAQQLHERVDDHNGRGYDHARTFMFEFLEVRDDGKLECIYTLERVEPDGTNLPGGVFNTEHTWPQSRGANTEPGRSDVHHLFPIDKDANNRRANHEFGHVDCDASSCPWQQDGSYLGPSADDDRDPIFEVRPDRRGNVARAILYYSLRYEEPVSAEEEAVLRQWNCEDPPDDFERYRNDEIENFQDNRNPFIDRPDFVDRIEVF